MANEYYVFVYGTLKTPGAFDGVLDGADLVKAVHYLDGYKLSDLGGCPGLIKGKETDSVIGDIYQVDFNTILKLDQIEGHPNLYERIKVSLDINRWHWEQIKYTPKIVEGYTYLYVNGSDQIFVPGVKKDSRVTVRYCDRMDINEYTWG